MTDKLTESRRLKLLANRHRRTVVTVLQERDEPVSVEELVDLLVSRDSEDPTEAERRNVRVSLHHNHLPQLQAFDVLSYDVDAGTVSLRPAADRLTRPVDPAGDDSSRRVDA